jgi:hypothetical protein
MNHSPIPNTRGPNSLRLRETRLHGGWLALARTMWIVVITFSVGLFVTASVLYARWLNEPDKFLQTYLLHLDPSASGYIAFNFHFAILFRGDIGLLVVLLSISSVLWIAVGLALFWRKSDDWMTLLAGLGLVTFGVTLAPQLSIMYILADQHAVWRVLITCVNVLAWGSIGLFAYLFPAGRFVPRWTIWAALCYLAWQIPQSVPANSPISIEQWPPLLLACVEFVVLFSPLYAQIYRYRHLSSAVERQQTKWVVFGLVLTLVAEGMIFLPPLFFPPLAQPGLPRSLYILISACFFPLLLNLIPLTIGIAVLRYRLWDIDVLINRTLVYGALTALLACIYVGLVVALQFLLRGLFSQTNDVALVGSTLAIAALFQPLRRHIQKSIDRRFYRRKYDAAQTLAAFSARLRLRDDVELTALTNDLLTIVEETMQPAHVSLWLCNPQRSQEQTTRVLHSMDEQE